MSEFFVAFVTTFAVVLAVELPDKTLVATVILTTRYRPRAVFAGVCAAFAVQCVVAVAFGSVLTLLAPRLVSGVVAAMFLLGAILLLREGFRRSGSEPADPMHATSPISFWRSALACLGVLFAAEWGDASQLATAGLVAKYGQPLAVGLAAFLALIAVASLAIVMGTKIRARIPTRWIQRGAGVLFLGFALWAAIQACG